jgi:hypothetical protein
VLVELWAEGWERKMVPVDWGLLDVTFASAVPTL